MFNKLLEQIKRIDENKVPIVYWSDKTDDSYYDSLIRNPDKAQKKKLDVYVRRMSPEEYLELAFKFDYSSKAAFIEDAYPKTIKYMKDLMLDPTKQEIDLPFIDFAKEEQEGRHRAIAAVELGVTEIPVLIIKRK
jgi:hypothetical protein